MNFYDTKLCTWFIVILFTADVAMLIYTFP